VDSVTDLVLLLLYSNRRLHGSAPLSGTTKLQKLLFLLTKSVHYKALTAEGETPEVPFEPYKMGPFTAELYKAVDLLANFNPPLMTSIPAIAGSPDRTETNRYLDDTDLDRTWSPTPSPASYGLTNDGVVVASQLWEAAPARLRDAIGEVVKAYGSMPIRELLQLVYSKYPEMTIRSEIRDELGMG
jgi:hypothetical protein